MKVDVGTEVIIHRPIEEVAAFSANPKNATAWYTNIKSVEWQGPPVVAVGSRVTFVAHFLGRRLRYTYEIVELAANTRFVMRTADGPFPMETTYSWSITPDGNTRMVLRNRGEPTGFARWLTPFMSWAMERANKKDLARLKTLLEQRSTL